MEKIFIKRQFQSIAIFRHILFWERIMQTCPCKSLHQFSKHYQANAETRNQITFSHWIITLFFPSIFSVPFECFMLYKSFSIQSLICIQVKESLTGFWNKIYEQVKRAIVIKALNKVRFDYTVNDFKKIPLIMKYQRIYSF